MFSTTALTVYQKKSGLLAVCSTTTLQPNADAVTKTQPPAKSVGCC